MFSCVLVRFFYVSIPYRYATNVHYRRELPAVTLVSIPYRYATNFMFPWTRSARMKKFQFLIGTLQTAVLVQP